MEFSQELVNGFLLAMLIAALLALYTILFYVAKEYLPSSLVKMALLNFGSFFRVKKKEGNKKKYKSEENIIVRNRLYLLLLTNENSTNISRLLALLNKKNSGVIKNLFCEPFTIENLERNVLGYYQPKRLRKYKPLFNYLSANQKCQLEKTEHLLYTMGVDVYSDCNIDEELGSILAKMTLTELIDSIAKIKKATGMNSKEAFILLKIKTNQHISGILDFGLEKNQISDIEDVKVKKNNTEINEKNADEISYNFSQVLNLMDMTKHYKDLDYSRLTKINHQITTNNFNESIRKMNYSLQNKVHVNKVNLEPNEVNVSFELPLSESLGMNAFTQRTLSGMGNCNKDLKSLPEVESKSYKQQGKKNSKR